MDKRCYYLGFNLINGIGPVRTNRLIELFGSVEAAWKASHSELLHAGLDSRSTEQLLTKRRSFDLEALLEDALKQGIQVICREDPDYPSLLSHVPNPPPLLYVRGTLHPNDQWALAVVGTRKPSNYGREVTRRFVEELCHAGITIVSGLALGIDTIAHSTALEAGGRTIAVLGCGVDISYPERNHQLAQQICEQGALVSDYPIGTKPIANNFPPRNRIISGLSLGTLVVEAGQRSGSLITVDFALEQGREVYAVPGQIYNGPSMGTNELIRSGASLASSPQIILDDLNLAGAMVQQEIADIVPHDPIEAEILKWLSPNPIHIDELGRASGLSSSQLLAALSMLELKGSVRQLGGMQFVRAR
jgi:DNA processing protein